MNQTASLENQVIKNAQKGDRQAFGTIYDWYVKKIYQFIFFKTNNTELAEDITQDVFLKLIKYLKNTQRVKSLQALLYQIARNLVNDYYRTNLNKQISNIEDIAESEITRIDVKGDLEELIEMEHSIDQIKHALEFLKDEYKEIIVLKYIEDLTHKEIAQILDKKENHIRVILHRAIKELKQTLQAN